MEIQGSAAVEGPGDRVGGDAPVRAELQAVATGTWLRVTGLA
jgi:hypothetical protein